MRPIGPICPIGPIPNFIRRVFRPRQKFQRDPHALRINEFVRVPKVMLIDNQGKNLGEMETWKALELARERELDLVEVFPKAYPPVCKIMDYGKRQYQQSKQARLAQAKQKKVELKGIRIGLKTDEHDLTFKKNQADKFLSKGNKVKIELVLKGREKMHRDLGRKNLESFISGLSTPHKFEEPIKGTPQGFNVIVAPE
ncbi:MAG: translation initiation factor IF-3 [Patescibacteria group bacterium]